MMNKQTSDKQCKEFTVTLNACAECPSYHQEGSTAGMCDQLNRHISFDAYEYQGVDAQCPLPDHREKKDA